MVFPEYNKNNLNTVMNCISKSKKEKVVMTPLSLISAICFWVTAL